MPPARTQPQRMCIVTTIAMPMQVFMGPHIRELTRHFEITLVANGAADELANLLTPRVNFERVGIQRGISLPSDLRSLISLVRLFRRRRFAVVQSMMPKSGLLAMMAAALTGVPVRIHWFTGQVWANRKGAARLLLKTMDRVLAACATHLLTDSPSQRAFLIAEGVVRPNQIRVLGSGSVCGVDTARFRPDPLRRARIRAQFGIAESAVVSLYLGRLNRDKGIAVLAEAFAVAARDRPDLHLLLVGPDEEGMRGFVQGRLAAYAERVHFADFTTEPEAYFASADFFVLPSHREGFGSTVIESAACAVTAIGTRIYGLTDAIVHQETGLLVPVGDVSSLAAAISRLANDCSLRSSLGANALERVRRDFTQERLTAELIRFYEALGL